MQLPELLHSLTIQGFSLASAGCNTIEVRGPTARLTQSQKEALALHKLTLLVMLGAQATPEPTPEPTACVVNIRDCPTNWREDSSFIYVGRANPRERLPASPWGNPFREGKQGSRAEVIQKYRDWILEQPSLLACLSDLRGKRLVCYCSPLPCHGDVLAELLREADTYAQEERLAIQREAEAPEEATAFLEAEEEEPIDWWEHLSPADLAWLTPPQPFLHKLRCGLCGGRNHHSAGCVAEPRLSWGKHAGKPLAQVPEGYLAFLLRQQVGGESDRRLMLEELQRRAVKYRSGKWERFAFPDASTIAYNESETPQEWLPEASLAIPFNQERK